MVGIFQLDLNGTPLFTTSLVGLQLPEDFNPLEVTHGEHLAHHLTVDFVCLFGVFVDDVLHLHPQTCCFLVS